MDGVRHDDGPATVTFALNYDLRVGQQSVRMRSSGTGRPLVMIHDLGGSAASFDRLLSAVVADGRSPVAIDLPGSGHSDTLDSHCLATVVDRLDIAIRSVAETGVDVIGRGFGGYLALTLAARHPVLFDHIVLEDPMLPPLHRSVAVRMRSEMAVRGAVTAVRRGRIGQNLSGYGRAKALLAEVSSPDAAWWAGLEDVHALTLLLDGRRSNRVDRERIIHLADVLTGATRGNLTDDRGAGYQAAIIDFLRRRPASAGPSAR